MNFTEFVSSMVQPLKRLLDLDGRSTRAEFWPFVFLLYAAQQIIGYILTNPMLIRIEAMGQGGAEPDFRLLLTETLTPLMWISAATVPLSIFLYFAAVTRRLHDTNRSGFHAFPAMITQVAAMGLMWHCVQEFLAADEWAWPSMFIPMVIAGVLNLVAFLYVVVVCVFDGTVGPNDYGPDPKGRTLESEALRVAQWMGQGAPGQTRGSAGSPTPARIVDRDPKRY